MCRAITKILITLLIILFTTSLGNASWEADGKYIVKGDKTIYTRQLKHYTYGDTKPKHPSKGDKFKDKKDKKEYEWDGEKWVKIKE